MKHIVRTVLLCLSMASPLAFGAPLSIDLQAADSNPASPQMGDNLAFHSIIRNIGTTPVDGLIAWISLVQVDRGHERPVGLEDWSAEKAVTRSAVQPGARVETDWPMRLIQSGHYRVVVSAATRHGAALTTSPVVDFTVRAKPVVESRRVLPVTLGIPLLIVLGMIWSWRRRG